MTNLPSREELNDALNDFLIGLDAPDGEYWKRYQGMIDNLYSAAMEPLSLEKAKLISLAAEVGDILTVNDVRTKILGWPPLPPDDHRGNSLLRRDP